MGEPKDLIIRTSDRGLYRRCRRRWGWQSALKGNLEPREKIDAFWLGTGFHFALEDFHGYHRFEKASQAFYEYAVASNKATPNDFPSEAEEMVKLATAMLDYYQDGWLKGRTPLATYVVDGHPQCEVTFEIPLPLDPPEGYTGVVYQGTFDRIAIDDLGRLWIVEYKTAKRFATGHFSTDPQVNAYAWAAYTVYHKPIAGVVYQQHRKVMPEYPRLLSTGKYSTDKSMQTTHRMYREALLKLYGEMHKVPKANVQFLNMLANEEEEEADRLIRRDRVYRNEHQIYAEGEKVLMEVKEMITPGLPLYPSPTRECIYQCPFYDACVSIDDGSDWEQSLYLTARPRIGTGYENPWRDHIRWPMANANDNLPSHVESLEVPNA